MSVETILIVGSLLLIILTVRILKPDFFKRDTGQVDSSANKKDSSFLDLYAEDLTQKALDGEIDAVIGREKEIDRLLQIISRRSKNNAILLGPAGVGKTAVVEGLAHRIANGEVPDTVKGKRILTLDLPNLMAGTKYRGEFEKRLKAFVDQIIASQRNIIVFIDEIHILAQSKGTEGAIDASDVLKPALARGELQAIGATTTEEYQQYFAQDLALARRFQTLDVAEPSVEYCYQILKGLKYLYENHHHVAIRDEALQGACMLSDQLIEDRYLPDKAIDVIDETAARLRLAVVPGSEKAEKLQKEKEEIRSQITPEMNAQKREKVEKSIESVERKIALLEDGEVAETPEMTVEEVKRTLAEWLNVDISQIHHRE